MEEYSIYTYTLGVAKYCKNYKMELSILMSLLILNALDENLLED